MGWPPSPAHILNQKSNPLGIPYDSVRSENALARHPGLRQDDGVDGPRFFGIDVP